MAHENSTKLTVYFDGGCPICTREIGYYQTCKGNETIDWVDLTASDGTKVTDGLTRQAALARFHVQTKDGELFSGGPAFAKLWMQLDKFYWLGKLFSFAATGWLLDRVYDVLLVIRPKMQKLFPPKENCETCKD